MNKFDMRKRIRRKSYIVRQKVKEEVRQENERELE